MKGKMLFLALVITSIFYGQIDSITEQEKILSDMLKKRSVLEQKRDSLNAVLKLFTEKIESRKQKDRFDKSQLPNWYEKAKSLTESIEARNKKIEALNSIIQTIKSELTLQYSHAIDSLQNLLEKDLPTKGRKEIQQQLQSLYDKRLSVLPDFKNVSFNLNTIEKISLNNVSDSLRTQIYREYLHNARKELNDLLAVVRLTKNEVEDLILLEDRTNRFLEEIENDEAMATFGEIALRQNSRMSEPAAEFAPQNKVTIQIQMQQLHQILEQIDRSESQKFGKFWVTPHDSSTISMTYEKYQEFLAVLERVLENYLDQINQKMNM